MKKFLSSGILILLLLTACKKKAPDDESLGSVLVQTVSKSKIDDLVKSSKGEITFLNVWASWCEPCREEFPDLLKFRETYAGKGARLEFLSADFPSDLKETKRLLTQMNVHFPTYIREADDQSFITGMDPQWSGALPTTFIFGPSGKMLARIDGSVTFEILEKRLHELQKK